MAIDFEREGLLDGLDDPQGREARLDLLRQLSDAGVSLEQLKRAVEEDRLLGLPLELVFTRGMLFTLADMMGELGFDESFVRHNYLALGLPLPALDEPALDDEDMESWRMLKLLFDAGISEEQILQLARPSGRWAAQLVDVLRQVFVEAFFEPGDTERDFGPRLAKLSADLVPTLGPLTERPVRLHLRERVRHDVISFTELSSGDLPGTREVGVSPDVPALVGAARTLVDAADEEEALPRLRAGLAAGSALNRGGDWYGRPVNLASRITDVAAAGNDRRIRGCGRRNAWPAMEAAGTTSAKGHRRGCCAVRARSLAATRALERRACAAAAPFPSAGTFTAECARP